MQHKIRTNYRNDSIATKVNTIISLINQINENITFDNTITNRFILSVNNKELVFHTYGEVINALKLVLLLRDNDDDSLEEIYCDISEFSNEVIKGKTYRERKEILWRCYATNPKKSDIDRLSLDDMVNYIATTDDYYEEDKKYIDACVALIKEVK